MPIAPRTAALPCLLVCLAQCGSPAAEHETAASIRFAAADGAHCEVSLDRLREDLSLEEVTVHDPHFAERRAFRAFSTTAVLDTYLGPSWREAPAVLVRCRDAYAVTLSRELLLQTPSWLASGFADGGPFVWHSGQPQHGTVPLGPLYLIWNDSTAAPAAYWAFQVTELSVGG
jgi:hypothetical protein